MGLSLCDMSDVSWQDPLQKELSLQKARPDVETKKTAL